MRPDARPTHARRKHFGEQGIPLVCFDGSQSMGEMRGAVSGSQRIRVSPSRFQTEAPVVGSVERCRGGALSRIFVLSPRSGATFANSKCTWGSVDCRDKNRLYGCGSG